MNGRPLGSRGRHALLAHTADAGFRASAVTLPELFEEAARALSELACEVGDGAQPAEWLTTELEGHDLPALAYAWLNELIGLAEVRRAALVAAHVQELERAGGPDDGWRLSARLGLCGIDEPEVQPLRQLKSATYHGLIVARRGGRWNMRAYVDI